MNKIELEIKSLLGSKEKADELKRKMQELDPGFKLLAKNSQLNHYFEPESGNLHTLYEKVAYLFDEDTKRKLENMANKAQSFSVRTRKKDDEVLLVVKASVDDTTSENGISRMEFEEKVPLSLDELDALVLDAGFKYQAKWSRDREEYLYKGLNVCIDKNAGFGHFAEFEKMLNEDEDLQIAKEELQNIMQELGVQELPQDRLQRMFEYYNQNWQDYYGTDKTFVIE